MTIPNLERHIYGDHDIVPDRTDEDPRCADEDREEAERREIAKEEADELKFEQQRDERRLRDS